MYPTEYIPDCNIFMQGKYSDVFHDIGLFAGIIQGSPVFWGHQTYTYC